MYEQITVIGNVGKVTEEHGEKPYIRLSVGSNAFHKDKNGKEQEQTNWYTITLWDTKRIEYYKGKIRKGSLVLASGTPNLRFYEKDGKTGHDLAIVTEYGGKFKVLRYADGKDA